ncbi:hypothetical protein [Stenotrophomonas sp. PD6]|uniref:hypothetical protein n=1 Tax=Stenotrophomonas sp. PD6 TaxID=3368612 RepID=UPI003BA2AA24
MSVKVAQHSEALSAPGPVAPVALSQRVEARHGQGSNDQARHETAAPLAERLPDDGGDACETPWADRRAALREQATAEVAFIVAPPGNAAPLVLLPPSGVAGAHAPGEPPATPAIVAGAVDGEPVASGATAALGRPSTGAAPVPVSALDTKTPMRSGSDAASPAVAPLPLVSTRLPAVATPPAAEGQPAPSAASTMLTRATTATVPTPKAVPGTAAQAALSLRGVTDPAAAVPSPSPSPSPATPTTEPTQTALVDAGTPPPTAPAVAVAPAGVDASAQPAAGGESLLTAARAEANVTTRKIVHAAQQATALQASMAARIQPASQVNVAFRSWGVDASGSAHSVRVRLQDGQAIVQPGTARVGQALAAAELPVGVDLQPAVDQNSTATDERRRRRGQQPSP